MKTRTRFAGILTAITMTAALAACSSQSDSGSDSGGSDGTSSDIAASAPEMAEGSSEGARTGAEDSASGTGPGISSTAVDSSAAPSERAVISTGTVSLRSKDVAEARREVQRVVDAQGGDITDENTETDDEGTTSYSRLVVRVPSPRFNATMIALEETAELRSSNRSAEDVTTQVIDTDVRVRAQEASLRRVELLLSRAQSLKDIIWIESQLTSRQAELDSLKSQQSWLEDQTTFATITVDITAIAEKEKVEKEDEQEAGFLVGLQGGLKALGAAASAVATVVGALLPFAVLLLVIGFPVWLLLRRRRTTQSVTVDAG